MHNMALKKRLHGILTTKHMSQMGTSPTPKVITKVMIFQNTNFIMQKQKSYLSMKIDGFVEQNIYPRNATLTIHVASCMVKSALFEIFTKTQVLK